ncbi:DNA-directed RNA polymerase [Aspergillus ibericus CBS 121593]|uniref:DNA-directed RNA polymerase n=1 Tax=Aspergillus ibericus CBS 121593 TaxID=1448316 RepID=A0A395HCL4_9EURO|nr:DNA/RNA polymerase [Aspergillus ibericus CBS 121593]RAL04698.1 DNA/RNA polymerase [Aspergillus ibericus CBS 121593]
MLSRVALQKNAFARLRLAKGRSVLPSTAPLRLHSHSSRPISLTNTSANITQERSRRLSFQSSRNLATAADQSAVDQASYGSFESPAYNPERYYDHQLSSFFSPIAHDFDPSSLVIVNDALQTKPKVLRRVKGLGGDEEEMLANFDLSLRLHRYDRAAILLTRLRGYYPVASSKYLALHNRYLEGMVGQMILTRQHNLVLPMQKFFEVDLPASGVIPDATTYAIMIRMALRMFHGTKRDRAVRRYWDFAKKASLEEDVLAAPVLSELEIGELSEICSSDIQRVSMGSLESDTAPEGNGQSDTLKDVPEIKSVEQKGLGLSSLKESLSLFSNASKVPVPAEGEFSPEEAQELYNLSRQRQLEADSIQAALNRWRQENTDRKKAGLDTTGSEKRLGNIINQWHTDLVTRIEEELKLVEEAESKPPRNTEETERCEYGVFLRCVDPDKLAALTILSVLSSFGRGGMDSGLKLASLATGIGSELHDEFLAERTLQKEATAEAGKVRAIKQTLAIRKQKDGRARWHTIVRNLEKDDPTVAWSPRVKAKVGAALMSFLFEVAKAPVKIENPESKKIEMSMQPAFQHAYQITWGRRAGFIHLHPAIVKIVTKEPTSDLLGRHLPMLCKPRPWKSMNDGGYHVYKSHLIRTTPGETLQPAYVKAALENGGLEQVRHGLDILGTTGWVINEAVFNVMVEAWNSGEAIADLAPLEPNLPHPPKPSPEEGYEAEKKWDNDMREIENRRAGFHSQRCFQNFQMEVARAYKNDTFYLPHNLDFRGRAYPLPPYLNQMGADNARGLLLFSVAKPLGASGLRWLKVQIANLSGFDKASLSEREKFTMDHLDDVLDSANNGLHGRRWWLKADDPWQCLAACCELRNALQQADPTQYASRLPIHQDGSCNGLQHYAALGGDKIGAQQVNLEPSDRPSDVYTGVAEFVKEAVAREAAQGHSVAKFLEGKITRKVVKQTVMTNVYGVTFMGAMKQVRKQLIDHYPELSQEQKHQGAIYIARKVFEALGTMFNGAHDIQYWLGDCASRITQSLAPDQIEQIAKEAMTPESAKQIEDPTKKFRSTVIWTTPLGLPVVQPYRVRKARRIHTTLQDLSIVDGSSGDVVSKRKQLQAFPPNFIHSLDATHMMLSAIACHRAGLQFSAVHDSFWTHACDVDSMNQLLREAFVRMHSDDVVKRLAAEFEVRYSQNLFLAKVEAYSPLGQKIRTLRKGTKVTQKATKVHEMLEEHKRQKLLRSEDPELQAQGRAMVTPASIFEEFGSDEDLAIASSLGETAVGHVPEDLAAAERKISGMEADPTDPAIETLFQGFDNVLGDKADPHEATPAEEEPAPAKRKTKAKAKTYVYIWLPLRFRPVPTKGSWDVTRIRDSKYFFC